MDWEVIKQHFDLVLEELEEVGKSDYSDIAIIEEFVQKVLLKMTEKYDELESAQG